jgi:serine/threonine protein kinase
MFRTCVTNEMIVQLQKGDLSDFEKKQVEEHIRECRQCELRALELQKVVEGPPTPSTGESATSDSVEQEVSHDTPSLITVRPQRFPFLRPALQPDEIGRLGNFRVLELIGRGGIGFVFRAEDRRLDRMVALKVIQPGSNSAYEFRKRFLREARFLAKLRHENLVTIHQIDEEGEVVYLVMELLKGETLEGRLKRLGPPQLSTFFRMAREIARGLEAVHAAGLVHRDVKPSNIWLEFPGETVKLIDFGMAKYIDDDVRMTKSGVIVGTPAFMSPEQARGEALDGRSDLFSFGSVLYFMCAGKLPFKGNNTTAVLLSLAMDTPPPIRTFNAEVPHALSQLILDMLAKEPDERPESAEAVYQRLLEIEEETSEVLPSSEVEVVQEPTAVTKIQAVGSPRTRKKTKSRRKARRALNWTLLLGIAVGIIGLGLSLYFAYTRSPQSNRNEASQKSDGLTNQTAPDPVYLTSLTPVATKDWPFRPPDGRNIPNFFELIRANGKVSQHGIGMHPIREPSVSITYRLDGRYREFRGEVSINDTSKGSPPTTFLIYGDDKLLWRSEPVTETGVGQSFNADITGVALLKLEIWVQGPSNRGAHAVWLEPHLLK